MITVRSSRVIVGVFTSAIAVVMLAGCSSQISGTPTPPDALDTSAAVASSTPNDRTSPAVGAVSTPPADQPSAATIPVQVGVVTVANSPSESSASTTTNPAPPTTASSRPSSAVIAIVTARVSEFDPKTGALSYVLQVRNHPTDQAPYYGDDPADGRERHATVSHDAPIRFVFSSCSEPYGELSEGGIACTPADLAAVVARGYFIARLDIVDGSIATITQVFQS